MTIIELERRALALILGHVAVLVVIQLRSDL